MATLAVVSYEDGIIMETNNCKFHSSILESTKTDFFFLKKKDSYHHPIFKNEYDLLTELS